jgi:hypothetical protein
LAGWEAGADGTCFMVLKRRVSNANIVKMKHYTYSVTVTVTATPVQVSSTTGYMADATANMAAAMMVNLILTDLVLLGIEKIKVGYKALD